MEFNGRIRIITPKVVHETIDGETVILNLDNGNYYSLMGTGAVIWDFIDHGAAVHTIIDELSRRCDGNRDEIEQAVHIFLSELMEEELTLPDGDHASDTFSSVDAHVDFSVNGKKISFVSPVLNKYTDMQDLLLLDPIHDVDDASGWPNTGDRQSWPTRNPDKSADNK